MALRINTNIAALNATRILNRSTQSLNTTLQRLSSGLRINSAKDDAAGLAIAEGFRSAARGAAVAQRNGQDGISLVQTAEGALVETTNMLQRMRELAVQAANGTQSDTNRASIDAEVQQLRQQIDQIAQNSEFNGLTLIDGSHSFTFQVGFRAGQTLSVNTMSARAVALHINNISVSTQTLASSSISTLDLALQSVTTMRGNLGAYQNRLEFTINNLAIMEENARASESAIRDADIARETTNFTRTQILVSAGTSVLAQANVLPQTALQLLK